MKYADWQAASAWPLQPERRFEYEGGKLPPCVRAVFIRRSATLCRQSFSRQVFAVQFPSGCGGLPIRNPIPSFRTGYLNSGVTK
jgi:hypothetical protein